MGLRIALLASLAAVALAPIAVLGWAARPLLEEVRRQRIEEFDALARPSFGLFDDAAQQSIDGLRRVQQGIRERELDLTRLASEERWWGKRRDLERLREALDRLAEGSGLDSVVARSGGRTLYEWPDSREDVGQLPAGPGLAAGWRWDPERDLLAYMHALPVSNSAAGPPVTLAGWRRWPRDELAAELRERLGAPAGVTVVLRGRLPGSPPMSPKPGVLVRELPSPRNEATIAAVIDARQLAVPMAQRLRSTLLAVAVVGAMAAAMLTLILTRALSRPLTRLTTAVDEVADGQPPAGGMPSGPGEIGRLASAVDRMLAREQRERTERRRAERTAAWQEVARRVAHEVRNPLTPIRLAVDNLLRAHRRGPEVLARSVPEETAAIAEEVERLDRLVREFSEFARLPRPRPAPTDLVPLARRAVEGQLPEAGVGAVELDVSAPSAPVVAAVDADLIALALANLAANAVRALGEEGGRLQLTIDPEPVAAGPSKVAIYLEDDGPGISEDLLETLFEPYVSGRVGENVGLGLAMVRQIAAEHSGHIEADNRPEGGARFRMLLPRGPSGPPGRND